MLFDKVDRTFPFALAKEHMYWTCHCKQYKLNVGSSHLFTGSVWLLFRQLGRGRPSKCLQRHQRRWCKIIKIIKIYSLQCKVYSEHCNTYIALYSTLYSFNLQYTAYSVNFTLLTIF